MNKMPAFQAYGEDEPGLREEWFRDIIQQFYENNKFKLLSVQDIQQLNKETVLYMMQDLKDKRVQPVATSFFSGSSSGFRGENLKTASRSGQSTAFPSTESERKSVLRDYISEKKQEELDRKFNDRQKTYDSMLQRGPQNDIDFRMSEDKPIENMDALVKRHLEERDAELQQVLSSRPLTDELGVIELQNSQLNSGLRSGSGLGSGFSSYRSEPTSSSNSQRLSKSVHWAADKPHGQSSSQDTTGLHGFMKEMKDYMFSMREELNHLKRGTIINEDVQERPKLQGLKTNSLQNDNPAVSNILGRLRRKNVGSAGSMGSNFHAMNTKTNVNNFRPSISYQLSEELEDISNTF